MCADLWHSLFGLGAMMVEGRSGTGWERMRLAPVGEPVVVRDDEGAEALAILPDCLSIRYVAGKLIGTPVGWRWRTLGY